MTGEKTYEDTEVYLTDLLDKQDNPPKLDGFTFRKCRIHGPMVVVQVHNVRFNRCEFTVRNIDEMFFEIPAGTPKVGVVGLLDCLFEDCVIDGMAVMGPPDFLDWLRQSFGPPPGQK
jgi:hypothetical protein